MVSVSPSSQLPQQNWHESMDEQEKVAHAQAAMMAIQALKAYSMCVPNDGVPHGLAASVMGVVTGSRNMDDLAPLFKQVRARHGVLEALIGALNIQRGPIMAAKISLETVLLLDGKDSRAVLEGVSGSMRAMTESLSSARV